jgi:hypothetical protein
MTVTPLAPLTVDQPGVEDIEYWQEEEDDEAVEECS